MNLALSNLDDRLALAQNRARFGIWLRDLKTGECDWDQISRELFGLDLESPVNDRVVAERVHPDDLEFVRSEIFEPMSAGKNVRAQHRVILPSGEIRWVTTNGKPVLDADGNATKFVGVVFDTTDRKEAELALQNSEALFRNTFQNAAVGIAHLATDGRWLKVNDKLCEIVGYSRDELFQLTFGDITHPDDLETDWSLAKQVLAGEIETYSMEKRYFRKDGSLVWINLTVSLARKTNGEPDFFISIIEDISVRKTAETELAVSRERLAQAKDAAHLGIYDYYPASGKLISDQRVRSLWGFVNEAEISFEMIFSRIHPEDRNHVQAAIDAAFSPNGNGQFYDEYRVIQKETEKLLWIAASGKVFFENNEAVRLVGTVQDITRRRESENKLRELTELLEEKVAERTELAERRSANLRRLAQEITNAEESARRKVASFIHDDLQQILVAAKMRIPSSKSTIEPKNLEAFRKLLDEAISRSRSLVTQLSPPVLTEGSFSEAIYWLADQMKTNHGLHVSVTIDETLPRMEIEMKTAALSIAREFLFNSAKHSGSPHASVEVSCSGDSLQMVVSDQGKGFDPATLDDPNEKFGIFSIRERVRAFGGSLKISSAPGHGTSCQFNLPIRGYSKPVKSRTPDFDAEKEFEVLVVERREIYRHGILNSLSEQTGFTLHATKHSSEIDETLQGFSKGKVVIIGLKRDLSTELTLIQSLLEQHEGLLLLAIAHNPDDPALNPLKERAKIRIVPRSIDTSALAGTLRSLCSEDNLHPS